MNDKIELTIYDSFIKGVGSIVVDNIAKAREYAKLWWDAEIDLPAEEEEGFSAADIVTKICGNHVRIGVASVI